MRTTTRPRRTAGFTMIEVLVVIAVLAVVTVWMLSSYNSRRGRGSPWIKCVTNLKNVGLAYRIFSTDHDDLFPMRLSTNRGGSLEYGSDAGSVFRHFQMLSNELNMPRILHCPTDHKCPVS